MWPFIGGGDVSSWPVMADDTPVKDAIAGEIRVMSHIRLDAVSFELSGNRRDGILQEIEPIHPIGQRGLNRLIGDVIGLRYERTHWHACSMVPESWASGYNASTSSYNAIGTVLPKTKTEATPYTIVSFPAEIRPLSTGFYIGILWTQIGVYNSRSIRVTGTIGGIPFAGTGNQQSYICNRENQDGLFSAHGTKNPLEWGTEDTLGPEDIEKLTLSMFKIERPSSISDGDLVTVELTITDTDPDNAEAQNAIHIYAASVVETFN